MNYLTLDEVKKRNWMHLDSKNQETIKLFNLQIEIFTMHASQVRFP